MSPDLEAEVRSDYAVRDQLSAVVRLRADLIIQPQPGGQQPGYLIEDPLRGRFFHVGLAEFTVLSLLDAQHSIGDVLALAARSLGSQALGEQEVLAICRWVVETGLAHTDPSAARARMCQSQQEAIRRRRLARLNVLAVRIPLGNPDRIATTIEPWLRWLTTPWCFVAWLLVVGWAGWIAACDWRALADAPLVLLDPAGAMRLLAAWVGLKIWHETMHAVVCKKYGGRIASAGVMLLFFTPVAFVDVTSSWRFRSRWQRIATAAAGMYGECLAGAIALMAWSHLPSGGARHLAYCISVMALVHTLVFNANPLMRFDGYYILSDLCGVPNLAQRGSQFVAALLAQLVLDQRWPLPAWPRHVVRIVRLYGLASIAWRTLVYVSLGLIFVGWLSYAGAALALAMLALLAARPLMRAIQRAAQQGWPVALPWRRLAVSGACAAAIVTGLLVFAAWPGLVRVPGVVEFAPLVIVRAASPGFVRQMHAADGAHVESGQVLVVLENEEIQRKLRDVALELKQATIKSRQHHQNQELAKYQAEVARRDSLQKKLAEAQAEVDQLSIRAAASGRFVARRLDQLAGRYLEAGEEIGVIGNQRFKEVRLAINHEDVRLAADHVGRELTIRAGGAEPRSLPARLARVEPQGSSELAHPALSARVGGPLPVKPKQPDEASAGQTSYELLSPAFAGIAALGPEQSAQLHAGQRVVATFRSADETIAGRWRRSLLRWVYAQIAKGKGASG